MEIDSSFLRCSNLIDNTPEKNENMWIKDKGKTSNKKKWMENLQYLIVYNLYVYKAIYLFN